MFPRTIARPRILVAWEHGRNLGHLVRSSELAKVIEAGAGTVAWAVPPQYIANSMISGRGEPIHIAPTFARGAFPGVAWVGPEAAKRFLSFADVLLALGFCDAPAVEVALTRWLKLFDAVQPTAILCDYAPFALLAACVAGIPAAQITNGFDAPPPDFPPFDPTVRGPYIERINAQKVAQLDQTVSRAGRALGASDLRLAHFVEWAHLVIDGIPEMDLYGVRTKATYIGPFASSAHTGMPNWPDGKTGKRVFAYLRGNEAVPVLDALRSSGLSTCCLWPDAPKDELIRFRGTAVRVTREPQNLTVMLSQCDAVVNYGSSGLLNATLLAGKPQLMVPTDMEKVMFARRVEQQGAGLAWRAGSGNLGQAIDRLLNDAAISAAAQDVARRYAAGQLERQRNAFVDQLLRGCAWPRESAPADCASSKRSRFDG